MPVILTAVFSLSYSRATKAHCDGACQHTLNGTPVKVPPLLCLPENVLSDEASVSVKIFQIQAALCEHRL